MLNDTMPVIFFFQESTVNALKRNDLKLEDALSFDKVKNYLSIRDLAKMNVFPEYLSTIHGLGRDVVGADFAWKWQQCGCPAVKDKIDTMRALVAEGSITIEIRNELFSKHGFTNWPGDKEPFQIRPFGDRMLAVVVSEGALSDPRKNSETIRKLVRSMTKSLCIYQEYGSVLQGGLGLAYIKQLF